MSDLDQHSKKPSAEVLFEEALALEPNARAAYLDRACWDDAALHARVESLLNAHEDQSGFLPGGDSIETVAGNVTPSEETGALIGRYKLLEKLGEGGFGSVWAAEQREPVKRRVALKIIKLGMDTKQVVARFEAERQALAMMDHPNIAKVLDAGTTDTGRPYFVMELVKGIPITKYFEQEGTKVTEKLQLFVKVCQVIQHAHQKGIIHRDIKPSNVMVTLHDGEPVPKVIDFGIAKATQGELTDKTIYTQYSQFIGTPAYMSPEQAEMSGLDVDTRSDIYSLGVLLYEVLTGTTPFDIQELMASGIDEMRKIIRERDPVKPSTRLSQTNQLIDVDRALTSSARLSSDLDWIVLKCLEKDRARRYETANGLARDIERHLGNDPVLACPPSRIYRLHKAWRRNRIAVTASIAVVASLVLGIAGSLWMAAVAQQKKEEAELAKSSAEYQEKEAQEARADAVENARVARLNLYAADMNTVGNYLESGNLGVARELLNNHRPLAGEPDLRGWEWYYFHEKAQGDQLTRLEGHQTVVRKVAFSPDGSQLISMANDSSGMGGNELIVWDWKNGLQTKVFRLPGRIVNFDFSFDGSRIAILLANSELQLWDSSLSRSLLHTGQLNQGNPTIEIKGHPLCSPTRPVIYFCDRNRDLWAWNYQTQKAEIVVSGRRLGLQHITEDGLHLLVSIGGERKLFDIDAGRFVGNFGPSHDQGNVGRAWSTLLPNLEGIVFHGIERRGRLAIWREPEQEFRFPFPDEGGVGSPEMVTVSKDGKMLAIGSYDHDVAVWALDDLYRQGPDEPMVRWYGQGHEVWCTAMSPDGRFVASGGQDMAVLIWDLRAREKNSEIEGDFYPLNPIFSSDSRYAALCRGGQSVVVDLAARSEVLKLDTAVWPIRFSDDNRVLTTLAPSRLESYRLDSKELVDTKPLGFEVNMNGGRGRYFLQQVAQAGPWLAAKDIKGRTHIVNLETGKTDSTLNTKLKGGIKAISSDGKRLAITGEGGIEVWDLGSGELAQTFSGHDRPVMYLTFSPDNRLLASMSLDSTIRMWTLETGDVEVLRGHKRGTFGGAFSPDGRTLATVNHDRTLKLWNIAASREVASFPLPFDVRVPAFSPDGRFLIAFGGSEESKCLIWEAELGESK